MGIRYYAYAFDPEHTEQAFADPGSFIAVDPLADAWGFPPGASIATPSFEQAVSPATCCTSTRHGVRCNR